MTIKQAKKQIIKYGEIIDEKKFSPGTSGNLSIRYKDKILITSSGSSNGSLTYDDIILVDFDGNILKGDKKPSSEKLVHIEIYKKRADINAVIHVHPNYLSSFATARKSLEEPYMAENVFYFGKIPLADYALPSSMDLAKKTAEHFEKYNAVLMANHGFIVGDTDLQQAYLKLELAESYAQVVINAKILGGAVALTDKEVSEIIALKV